MSIRFGAWLDRRAAWVSQSAMVAGLSVGLFVAGYAMGQERKTATRVSGVEKGNFSKTIKADEDFFRFVNDTWLETTEIPADQSNYGSFTVLDIETKAAIREIIEKAGQSDSPSPIAKQVGDFYRSYTDIEARNAAGIAPVVPAVQEIRAILNKSMLLAYAGQLSRRGVAGFFGVGIEPDARRSDQYAVYVAQDGTSLPDRDYYLLDEPQYVEIRNAYVAFVAEMLGKIG
ncbi:MAG: peptidase M13, partial [Planctomycetes bacterium]|nr:peptidase M13 [Planctomycetota bacterium]